MTLLFLVHLLHVILGSSSTLICSCLIKYVLSVNLVSLIIVILDELDMFESQHCCHHCYLSYSLYIWLLQLCFLIFLPLSLLSFIFNSTARAINRTPKFFNISPVLKFLGWFKINEHVQFKILFNPYISPNSINRSIVCNLLTIQPVFSTRSFAIVTLLCTPYTWHLHLNDCSVSCFAPFLWNYLPWNFIKQLVSLQRLLLYLPRLFLLLNSILNERLISLPIHIIHSLLHPVDEIHWILSLLWVFI